MALQENTFYSYSTVKLSRPITTSSQSKWFKPDFYIGLQPNSKLHSVGVKTFSVDSACMSWIVYLLSV